MSTIQTVYNVKFTVQFLWLTCYLYDNACGYRSCCQRLLQLTSPLRQWAAAASNHLSITMTTTDTLCRMKSCSRYMPSSATVRRRSANQPNSRPYAPIDSTPSALTASVLITGAIPSHANEFFHRVGAMGVANGLGLKEEYFV